MVDFARALEGYPAPAAQTAAFADARILEVPGLRMWVGYLDGRPVGCGALRPLPAAGADVAEIKRMYTSPSARRRGVSRAVLVRLESEAAGFGYRQSLMSAANASSVRNVSASGWVGSESATRSAPASA